MECANDRGYFIVNGKEKTIIARSVAPDAILCWLDHNVPTAVCHSCANDIVIPMPLSMY